jgi:SAM-dependent methyltransferase
MDYNLLRDVMQRCFDSEILEQSDVPEPLVTRTYRELTRIHRLLGDTRAVVAALRRDPLPVRRVMDVGCGHGGVLAHVRKVLGVEVVGVDIRPPVAGQEAVPIILADATRDPLPAADVAFCMYLGHHLSDESLIALIRNVGRSCRRFILLDLVRHRLPLALFRCFVAPVTGPIVAADGRVSIRRSYTRSELKDLVGTALAGSGAHYRHFTAPLWVRQVADITYAGLD